MMVYSSGSNKGLSKLLVIERLISTSFNPTIISKSLLRESDSLSLDLENARRREKEKLMRRRKL